MRTQKNIEQKIVGYLQRGLNCTEISLILGMNAKHVQRLAKTLRGKDKVKQGAQHPKQRCAELLTQGFSKAETARRLKVHVNTVRNWAKNSPKFDE